MAKKEVIEVHIRNPKYKGDCKASIIQIGDSYTVGSLRSLTQPVEKDSVAVFVNINQNFYNTDMRDIARKWQVMGLRALPSLSL